MLLCLLLLILLCIAFSKSSTNHTASRKEHGPVSRCHHLRQHNPTRNVNIPMSLFNTITTTFGVSSSADVFNESCNRSTGVSVDSALQHGTNRATKGRHMLRPPRRYPRGSAVLQKFVYSLLNTSEQRSLNRPSLQC